MEACAPSHYWARELLAMGHDVRLIPPIYVKPYVKRGKNDAADAAAVCEAMSRPGMRFVPVIDGKPNGDMTMPNAAHTSVQRLGVDRLPTVWASSPCRLQNALDITSRLSLRFLRDQELRRQMHGGDLRRLHGSRSATADPEARPRQATCNRRGQATRRSAYPSRQPAGDAAFLPRRAAQHPHQRSMADLFRVV